MFVIPLRAEQPTTQSAEELRASAQVAAPRSVCLVVPAFTASLGSVTDYKLGCAYANEFPVAVEDLDVGKLRTIHQDAVGLLRRHIICHV